MAFQMNFTGVSPVRSSTPLHQNVSTNESFSLNENKERVRRLVTTTPDQIIPGTDAPPPVVTTTPGLKSTFDPGDVTYADDCRGIKSGPGRTGTFNCDPKPVDPIVVPPTEDVVLGKGTPPQIIPGSEDVKTEVIPRPTLLTSPSLGQASNQEGNYNRSGIGSINLPRLNLNLPRLNIELPTFRGLRNLVRGCKGGGCPKY
tara:strand:- start:7 stop:609 length:603 start_codon:yes stop_codon:yes gene_type:complete